LAEVTFFSTYDLIKITNDITLEIFDKKKFYSKVKTLFLSFGSPYEPLDPVVGKFSTLIGIAQVVDTSGLEGG
jgi:hypothetical protein